MSRVPPHASGGKDQPRAEELEQLEELGDDAIIAQEQGAHAPQPRVQVTEEARSVVISDHPPPGSDPPEAPKIPADPAVKRSARNEKTLVIRDRRQIDELRREIEKRRPKAAAPGGVPTRGLLLWVIVGVVAFLTGGLVALLATSDDGAATAVPPPVASQHTVPSAAPVVTAEPPAVSIDQLPIEDLKK